MIIRFCVICLCAITISNISYAGKIYGLIKDTNGFLEEKVLITIQGQKEYTTHTKKMGMYKIQIPEKGQLILKLHYKNTILSLKILSLNKPKRYDLLVKEENNKLTLQRI